MEEGFIDAKRAIVADYRVAEVAQRGVGSLNLPTFAIASECSSILSRLAHAVCLVRRDQFDASCLEALPQRVAIVGFIGNQPLRASAANRHAGGD